MPAAFFLNVKPSLQRNFDRFDGSIATPCWPSSQAADCCAAGRSAPVLAGILRAMADDYGALALIDCSAPQGGEEMVMIELLDNAYSVGRSFELTRAEC